jgi:glycerol-3-phosphate dehydrogenase
VQEALGLRASACATAQTPLIGGDVDVDAARVHLMNDGLTEIEAARLVQLYGSESPQAAGGPAVEARRAVLFEGAATLEDYWSRRSARAWFDPDAGLSALEPAAAEMAGLLGWSPDETQRQVAACRTIHDESLGFQGE